MDETITVEWVRDALVVGRLSEDGAAVLLAANLRSRRSNTYVVVGESVLDAVRDLDPWVLDDIDEATTGAITLVGPGLAAPGPDGSPAPAQRIAEILGTEVTAPAGVPVQLGDAGLFVPGTGWLTFHPDGTATQVGARLPAPWWQAGLPEDSRALTHVPAGLWLRHPDAPERPDDPLRMVPVDQDRMYLVLGAPGEALPSRAAVVELLRALPDEVRDRAVLVSYGAGPAARIAQQVADDLGAAVRAAHGVPNVDGGLSYVDRTGRACWQPFALESVYHPGAVPMLDRWTAPPRLPMIEPGTFRLAPGWRVDVVPRGLAVHPEEASLDRTMLAADTGPTADVVVAGGHLPDDARTALDRLIRELPAPARENLRVLPSDGPTAAAVSALEAAAAVVPLPSEVPYEPPEPVRAGGGLAITADGRIVPLGAAASVPDSAPGAGSEPVSEAAVAAVPVHTGAPRVARAHPARQAPDGDPAGAARVPAASPAAPGHVVGAPGGAPDMASVVSLLPGRTGPRSVPSALSRSDVEPATRPERTEQAGSSAPDQARTVETVPSPIPGPDPNPDASNEAAEQPVPETRTPRAGTRVVEVPEDARGTAAQRQAMRARLGARYDKAARVVSSLLSERPGLRSGGDRAAQLAELAVVRAFLDHPDDPDGQYDTDFHVVLADGLRRLPTARAVVVRGIPAGTDVRPDSVLRLPVAVIAAPVSAGAAGPAEALVWTTTGRRIDGLQDTATGEVVLPGHTRLRVLSVERGPVDRVLLAEEGAAHDAALARLRAVAGKRNGSTGPAVARWFGPLPVA